MFSSIHLSVGVFLRCNFFYVSLSLHCIILTVFMHVCCVSISISISISYRFGVIAAYCSNCGYFAFFSHPLRGLEATYDNHLKLIGKRVVDFLLVLIELFSLGVTSEVLRAKIDRKSVISLQRGFYDSKFQIDGVAPTNHFCTDS